MRLFLDGIKLISEGLFAVFRALDRLIEANPGHSRRQTPGIRANDGWPATARSQRFESTSSSPL